MSALLAVALAAQAYTSTAEVHACQPLADGRVVAATSGGLVLYGADLVPERVWTVLDGLPGTDMRTVLLTPDGIWVGGERGVARLRADGAAWRLGDASPVGDVRALLALDGRLLAATWGDGLVLVDPRTGRREPARATALDSVVTRRTTSLAAAGGVVYVGTAGEGLWTWDGAALRRASVALPSGFVWSLGQADGRVMAGTMAGLVDVRRSHVVSNVDARALLPDGAGWLVATMGEGLRRLGDGRESEEPFPAPFVTALGASADTTCAGTQDGLYVRRAGGAWRAARVTGPPSNDVSALARDGGRLWVGTFDRGLAVLEDGRFTTVDGVDPRVNALAVEPGARVWVATARGLASVENGRVHVLTRADGLPDDDVHAVAALRGGGVAAGTGRGAVLVRNGRVTVLGAKQGLPAHATWAVAEDASGALWLGTTNGLFVHRAGRPAQRLTVAGGHLRDDWVTSLAVDGTTVWAGTYAGGVSRLEVGAGGAVTARQEADGAHVNPAGLSLTAHEVWAATMEGLRVLPRDGGPSATSALAPGGDVTAVVHTADGRWVGSRSGLAFVRP